jgi:hypothetical protein
MISASIYASPTSLSNEVFDEALTRFYVIGMPHLPPIDYYDSSAMLPEPVCIYFHPSVRPDTMDLIHIGQL